MKTILIVAGVICVALIGAGVYFATRNPNSGPRLVAIDQSYNDRIKNQGWVKGASNPTVTVVEYADFQCPYCGELYAPLSAAMDETSSYAQLEYREYPLLNVHNKAKLSSEAAEAAGRQGKFWQMHDLLFSRQSSWASDTTFGFGTDLDNYAKELGLNVEQFDRDRKDSSIDDQINNDVSLGNQVPVTGTPTLVINGKQVTVTYDKDALVKLIQDARDAAASKS